MDKERQPEQGPVRLAEGGHKEHTLDLPAKKSSNRNIGNTSRYPQEHRAVLVLEYLGQVRHWGIRIGLQDPISRVY